MLVNVIFADSTEQEIKGYFGAPQDPATWPNQGQVDTSDARWIAFYDSLPEAMREGIPAPEGGE